MDLVSRLKEFLKQNGIANSQFADTCDIPRPTLSQLLNGRNKKVSDEIITKIHNAYPSLNIMWLMFGDGDMFVPNVNTAKDDKNALPSENSKFENGSTVAQEHRIPRQASIDFGEPDDSTYASYNGKETTTAEHNASRSTSPLSEAVQSIARTIGKNHTDANALGVTGQKRIVSIMVFYNDNSFETFTPHN